MGEVERRGSLRREAAALEVSDVRLGRTQRPPVSCDLESARLDRHEVQVEIRCPGVEQEALDHHLGLRVLPFTEVVVPDASVDVGDVDRGPEPVLEGAPHLIAAVDRDGILDA